MLSTSVKSNSNEQALFSLVPVPMQWAEAFCNAKRAEGLSRRTVDIYVGVMRNFIAWAALRNVAHVEALTPDDLRKFMLHLAEAGRNAGGQHLCYRVLKTFLRWYAEEAEPINWRNPIERLKAPKLPELPLQPVELPTVSLLLASTGSGRHAVRDRALLCCLIDCGLRANELTGLDVVDFSFADGALLVKHGKGSRIRTVFTGQKTRRALRAWIGARGNTPGALFTAHGGRLTYAGLRQVVRRLALRAGVPEPALHSFRRGYALAMLRAGCDVVTLSRLLGHSDLSLLRRYTKQTGEDLRAAAERHSPGDRL